MPQFPMCEVWMMTFCTLINVDRYYLLCARRHGCGPLEGDAESHPDTAAKAGWGQVPGTEETGREET